MLDPCFSDILVPYGLQTAAALEMCPGRSEVSSKIAVIDFNPLDPTGCRVLYAPPEEGHSSQHAVIESSERWLTTMIGL